jgi:hypothetical protein
MLLLAKQVILKGLPASFDAIKVPYLYGPEAHSLSRLSIAELMGFLRVYESDIDRGSRPRHDPGSPRAGAADAGRKKHCDFCGRDGHT